MSYVIPSVLVYQDLENSGGVLNSTPDLEACIVGPAYNKLEYVPGSISSQIKTAALSAVSTTGTISANSTSLEVLSTVGISVDDEIIVAGAGASGGDLKTSVVELSGNVVTVSTAASTSVTSAPVTKTGKLSNVNVDNEFSLPGQLPGQVIESSSVKVWVNNARVETLETGMRSAAGSNVLTMDAPVGATASITTGGSVATLNTVIGLSVGDQISIAGAGAAAANLVATVEFIDGLDVTITPAAVLSVTDAVVTKVLPANLNSSTNTLRVEPGDQIVVAYVNNASVAKTFTTNVRSVITSSGQNGTIASISMVDMAPADMSLIVTGNTTESSADVVLQDIAGFNVGDHVTVDGGATGGADLNAVITAVNVGTSTITLDEAVAATILGTNVYRLGRTSVSVLKTYNNQEIPLVKPISAGLNVDTSVVGTEGKVTIKTGPELVYGKLISGDIYIGYRALRTDLSNRVLTIEDANDLVGQLGTVSEDNPLALGIQVALANTIGRIRAIAVPSNDLSGYLNALDTAEGERVYALVPLTQDTAIVAAFKTHAEQMSTPENAAWRVAIVNTAIPSTQNIGPYSSGFVNANSGNNSITVISGKYTFTADNATFISDGVTPGDILHITQASPSTGIGAAKILEVVSNQQLVLDVSATATGVSYYVSRNLTKTQSAQAVAAQAKELGSNRAWLIQPDTVGVSVNGVVKYLPGYYLCCGLAGMVAGFPVQQGFTNIGVAGISDLKKSNYYFSKTNLNSMAEAGVCLFVQETQGGIPYCRHELTTDVTVLEYREMLKVKNWDYLSYFYYDKLKGFIGKWNITLDTINVIRQTLIASSELVKSKKLPRIGSPLLSYKIRKLEQNKYNKDHLDCELVIEIVSPLNYLNLHLVI